jgi:hypothetical protein
LQTRCETDGTWVTWRPAANVAAYNPALLLDARVHAFIEAKSGTHAIGYLLAYPCKPDVAVHSAISNAHQGLDEHDNPLGHGGSNDGDGGSGASSVARRGRRDRVERQGDRDCRGRTKTAARAGGEDSSEAKRHETQPQMTRPQPYSLLCENERKMRVADYVTRQPAV